MFAEYIRTVSEALLHMHYISWPLLSSRNLHQPEPLETGVCVSHYHIDSSSGNKLGVWMVNPVEGTDEVSAVCIFIHGQLGHRGQKHRREALRYLSSHFNAAVVTYDPSGYGDSTGWPTVENIRADAESVLTWTQQKFGTNNKKIKYFLWGHSLGGPIASYLAHKRSEDISGLVIDSSFCDLTDVFIESQVWGFIGTVLGKSRTKKMVKFLFADGFNTGKYLSQFNKNILILHGTDDVIVPSNSVLKLKNLFERGSKNCTFHLIYGGGHNDLHTGKYFDIIKERINKWLAYNE
jgi:pimeloyl-ACP methyl ester carboxylesterase